MKSKIKLIIGAVSLFVAGIVSSLFIVHYQKDWIMLLAVILFSMIYIKWLRSEELIQNIQERLPQKMLTVIAIILIFIGLSLMPDSFGAIVNGSVQLVMYIVSFICWMCGMMLLDIRFNKISQ